MPKDPSIKSVLIIGSGPIIIGQACEFDYSGAQACKALQEEGYRIILVNSNPATIMTDPETADRVYIEPVTPETLCKVIEKERPDAVLPTLGGQTALNTTIDAAKTGIFEKYNIDGIWHNSVNFHNVCYCNRFQDLYFEKYQKKIKEKKGDDCRGEKTFIRRRGAQVD